MNSPSQPKPTTEELIKKLVDMNANREPRPHFDKIIDLYNLAFSMSDRLQQQQAEIEKLNDILNEYTPKCECCKNTSYPLANIMGDMVCYKCMVDVLQSKLTTAKEALESIESWCNAYPKTVFIEPTTEDWKSIRNILKEKGFTLDAISASNMRHVLDGVKESVVKALAKIEQKEGE